MTKLILLLTKRADLSDEAFRRHWREHHVPLLLRLPGIRGLRLNYVQPDPSGAPATIDGIAESWYDDPAALRSVVASPEAQAVFADAATFLDLGRLRTLVVEEEVVLAPAPPAPAAVA